MQGNCCVLNVVHILIAATLLVLISIPPSLAILSESERNVPDFVLRHAPLIWLHSEDPFMPSDILQHVRHTTPLIDFKPVKGLPDLDLNNLKLLNDYGLDIALTSNDDATKHPDWILGEAPDASGRIRDSTPCVVILVEKSPRDLDVFYFYFYSYDRGGNISQVLEPVNRLFDDMTEEQRKMSFGDHVGDWENNMIRFRDGEPTGIFYSQHTGGRAYDWSSKEVSKKDQRPIVYSASGSHANYAKPGEHVHDYVLVDYCDAGRRWDPVLSAYFFHLDPSTFNITRLSLSTDETPLDDLDSTSFFYFRGRWGDQQYPDDDPRQRTVPYFKLKRFQTGPTGPREKQLIRKGLFPDRRHKAGWIEWGVGVFMYWYPCCIRGWRKWASGIFVFGLLSSIACGVVYGVRRYRRRGYQKVESDFLLHDMGSRDSLDSLDELS